MVNLHWVEMEPRRFATGETLRYSRTVNYALVNATIPSAYCAETLYG